jgi:Mg-chelatase subunit ChlI
LQTGRRFFDPGLLASANRGVLYVDEVNLLDDHLVDLLLDAAASGVNTVERESLSFSHPSRFMLIGTMNPEEGELRPQFLDRFGLCVSLHPISNPASRELIVRQRLAFERDPVAFGQQWESMEQATTARLLAARMRLESIEIPDAIFSLTSALSQNLKVDGHRADITIIKAARAHAALMEKSVVEMEDLATAAKLALPHRISTSPLDSPQSIERTIDAALQRMAQTSNSSETNDDSPPEGEELPAFDMDDMAEQMQVPGGCAAGSILLTFLKKKSLNATSIPIPSSSPPTSTLKA